jgi:hypothetical protein
MLESLPKFRSLMAVGRSIYRWNICLIHHTAQLDEGTIFVNGEYPETEEDVINWFTAQIPGLYWGVSNRTAVEELLKYYPADPAAGSPYNTGNETFGQAAQYKRLTSIVGDLLFHVRE